MRHVTTILIFVSAVMSAAADVPKSVDYFAIEVVDAATGRGVPMVELQTTSGTRYYTDSAGLVAFYEPGLMSRRVFFGIAAHGYEYPPDGFGSRGVVLETTPGTAAKVKINRLNIAERLYRITGQGIYRDTVLLRRTPPIAEPLLNAQVTGLDSTQTAIFRGKLYWFYGDTQRLSYALGNFAMTGATTDLPDKIDPDVGINLQYFTGKDGFARAMAPRPGEGVVWLSGVTTLRDRQGTERLLAYFERRRGLGAVLEAGFMEFMKSAERFLITGAAAVDSPLRPQGRPLRVVDADGVARLYFSSPYPSVRVKADVDSYRDLSQYEAFTCLKPGTRSSGVDANVLDRDAQGRLVWSWKANSQPLSPEHQKQLTNGGKMKPGESPFRLRDADTGKPVLINSCSCEWNDYRKKFIMIASEAMGATMLGETWFAEADRPEGPWTAARRVVTHANKPGDTHDFYNPLLHPYFSRSGGRIVYFEGTYVNTFSGNPHPTPYYEYNQIMYRLDLDDPRLKLAKP